MRGTNSQLTSFNVFNRRDFGHFYTVATQDALPNPVTTVLSCAFTFYTSSLRTDYNTGAVDFLATGTYNEEITGDLLCYGSLLSGVVFFKN